ncbi:hypothetical protein BLNAU_13518 [Blattamonas nauphoetae]|uniref:Uncharacterized protein n=1 Tax=Blattamonas nauphoetae TaxID=2049346 RepID=A0ABQ9XHK6_9EUKA|nr:hypothetical protein BLNAU_13518 [Blattamonas nauphoetae]
MEQDFNLISGPLGPDNFVECTEVVFSVKSPKCAGYVVVFDTLPSNVETLFESCVDTSTETSFPSVADKTGNHTFSITSDILEVFVDAERGNDATMCGCPSNPCQSISYSCGVSSHIAFSISAIGNFSTRQHTVFITSPCMRLTSRPSKQSDRAALKYKLFQNPILHAPDNPFELSHLIFILETDMDDGVFFRAGQSSTHVRDILMHYTGQHRILLFFLAHASTSKFEIELNADQPPLNNVVLFSSDSAASVVDSSTFDDLVLSGSSTFLGTSKTTTIRNSSFNGVRSIEPFFTLSSSTLHLSSTLFQFCQVESNALIIVNEGSFLLIESSTFQGCTGREAGVALFTDKANTVSSFFEVNLINNRVSRQNKENQEKSSLFGNDLTIRGNPQLVNISSSRSSSFFPRVVVGDPDDVEVVDMFAQQQSVFHLNISGSDDHKCGSVIDACCSLQYTIAVTNETNKKDERTTLRPYGPFSEVCVFVGRRSVLLHGRGLAEFEAPTHRDEVMLIIDDSSVVFRQIVFRLTTSVFGRFISSSKSNLKLIDCSISSFLPSSVISSPDSSLHSLFSICSGSLVVSQLRSDNFQSTQHSSTLFVVDRANFNLKNTTLSSLSVESEGGLMCGTIQHTHFNLSDVLFEALQTPSNCGMLNLKVIDNGSVSLTETTFSHLNISSPLISLTLSSSLHLTTNSIVVDVSSLHVRSCRGTEIAGSVLLVDNPHDIQWTLTEPKGSKYLNEIEWDSYAEKRGTDKPRSLFDDDRIPPLPQYVVKDSVNNDVIDCGSAQLPCSSIDFAVCRIHPHRTNAVGVVLNSPVDLKEQLCDTRCLFVDGSNNTLTIVQRVVDSGAAIVVGEQFELVSVDVALPPNSSSLGRDFGIIECSSGSLSIRRVTMLQTTISGFLHRVIVLAVDTNVTISDCELSRLSTEDGILSLRFTNKTTPSFLFRNVSFVNCLPPSAVRIALTFSPEHGKVKMRDHFEKMRLNWKHPEWYSLKVGERNSSFLFDVVVHPAIWVGLGVAGLLAVLILPWLLCTPAMFPVMLCYRHHRNTTDSSNGSPCCKCLLPDGGRGQREHDPWDAIAQLNGIPNEYRYSTITDAKTSQQTDRKESERNSFYISDTDPTSYASHIHTTRQNRRRGASADSDSEDVLDSSDQSEEFI